MGSGRCLRSPHEVCRRGLFGHHPYKGNSALTSPERAPLWSRSNKGVCQGAPGLRSVQRLQGKVLPASSSFWGLQASIPGLVAASLPSLPRLHVASPLCLCLIWTRSLGLWLPLLQVLHFILSAETPFPNKAPFVGPGGEDVDASLGTAQPTVATMWTLPSGFPPQG